jgi:hypothetical protein
MKFSVVFCYKFVGGARVEARGIYGEGFAFTCILKPVSAEEFSIVVLSHALKSAKAFFAPHHLHHPAAPNRKNRQSLLKFAFLTRFVPLYVFP